MEASSNMLKIHAAPASHLPDATKREMDFLESSFFKNPDQCLPTPAQVRALSSDVSTSPQPQPIIFKNPNIFVKFGPYVTVAEAQCLWMIRRVFHGRIPVPEVFGWRIDEEDYVFIYMEFIQGQTLLDSWGDLTGLDKKSLCDQLCQIVRILRQLGQFSSDKYIGAAQSHNEIILKLMLTDSFQDLLTGNNFWTTSFKHNQMPVHS